MKTIKVGLIGAGAIAESHISGINAHPQAEVVAVADKSEKRAKELQKKCGLARRYTDAADMLSDTDIDAVSIALPNFLHAPMSIAALKAGKHVLLDKPFALNQKEAMSVITTAKAKRKVFMLGMNQRFAPQPQTIKAMVLRKDLGDLYHGKAYWLRRSGSPKFGTWFCDKKLSGGGSLLDIGVHVLDLCMYLMDAWQPVAVTGASYTKFCNRGIGEGGWGKSDVGKKIFTVDDFATALIKFKNGATIQLDASWALHMETGGRHEVELFGTEGGASAFAGKVFRYGKKKNEYEVVEPQNVKVPHPQHNRFYHWVDVILKKAKADATMEQALVVQKIIDGIYQSSASGKEARIR